MQTRLPQLIGVIHLPPLPGSPGASRQDASDALKKAGLWAVKEAKLFTQAGFEGIIIENFGDAPFYKSQVPPETIVSMSVIAAAVRESTRLPLGINVLRNDANSALAIAAVTGADFIRVNVLSGVVATDQGLIEGDAATLIRERIRLNAEHIAILADVQVKHAQTLSSVDLAIAIEETAGRGGADGVIVTGSTTGRSPETVRLQEAMVAAQHTGVPLYIGSGASLEKLKEYYSAGSSLVGVCVIVGSALRKGGRAGAPLDAKKVKEFARVFKSLQKQKKK
jgi:membrane complex biogenesis BtpA family protein